VTRLQRTIGITACAALLGAGLAACDDDSTPSADTATADAAADTTPADTAGDTPADTMADTAVDTGTDTMVDTAEDVPEEPAPTTPLEACNAIVQVTCERSLECLPSEQLATLGWSTVEDCVTDVAAVRDCATNAGNCGSGETYHFDLAVSCITDLREQVCGDIVGGILPASCEDICS